MCPPKAFAFSGSWNGPPATLRKSFYVEEGRAWTVHQGTAEPLIISSIIGLAARQPPRPTDHIGYGLDKSLGDLARRYLLDWHTSFQQVTVASVVIGWDVGAGRGGFRANNVQPPSMPSPFSRTDLVRRLSGLVAKNLQRKRQRGPGRVKRQKTARHTLRRACAFGLRLLNN